MKFVNKVRPSVDGKGLMMGKPGYTDDLAEVNSLVVKVLRSPHAHAKIVKINTGKAAALTGVECVLTYKDFKRIVDAEPWFKKDESHLELYYRFQLNDHISISPDLQVIRNAQGDARFDPVTVIGVRGGLDF